MSFTERFDALPADDKNQAAIEERQRRIKEDVDKYVAIPVAVPVMSRLSNHPTDFKLGWAVGVPGSQEDPAGKPARAALTLGFPDEDTVEDFCYMMNKVRAERNAFSVLT